MSPDDKLDKLLEGFGEIRSDIKNLTAYIGAVSNNEKSTAKELRDHVDDNEAHGQDIREKGQTNIMGYIALGISALVAAFDVMLKHK